MQQILTQASFHLLTVLFNWYTNILYCNKCMPCMTHFVSFKRSCIDVIKAVQRMYVQRKDSEEVGHFVSSKARPCLKVCRVPTASCEPTSYSPSVPSEATWAPDACQLHGTQGLSLRLTVQVSLRRRPELQTLADVKVFSCKSSIVRFYPNPEYLKYLLTNATLKVHANPSSYAEIVTHREIGKQVDMLQITATEQLHSFRSE